MGYIFELFVSSQICNFYGYGNVRINKEYKINGKHAEADVVLKLTMIFISLSAKMLRLYLRWRLVFDENKSANYKFLLQIK